MKKPANWKLRDMYGFVGDIGAVVGIIINNNIVNYFLVDFDASGMWVVPCFRGRKIRYFAFKDISLPDEWRFLNTLFEDCRSKEDYDIVMRRYHSGK